MTEQDYEDANEIKNNFYAAFSALVAAALCRVPVEYQRDFLDELNETANVMSCDYESYMGTAYATLNRLEDEGGAIGERFENVEREMCDDNTHPNHYLCVHYKGYSGPHVAEFLNSREQVRW